MRRWLLGALLTGASCVAAWDVEQRTFPCRQAADCVEGYQCHPTRFVCVTEVVVPDAAVSDLGTPDEGLRPDRADARTSTTADAGRKD